MTRLYLVRDEPIDYTSAFDAGSELEDECVGMSETEFYSVFAEVAMPGRLGGAEIVAESRRLVAAAETLQARALSALAAQGTKLAVLSANTRQAFLWTEAARTTTRCAAIATNRLPPRRNN